jgi:phosphatidylcholine synthase
MAQDGDPQRSHVGDGRPTPSHWRAFAIHILTASGAAFALLALLAAGAHDWAQMFAWLGAALIVDGIDGPLARQFKVAEILPRWSGEILDFVVDFVTYVFVPAYAIALSGLLPGMLAIPLAVLIVVTSAIYFADRGMKSADNYFVGFPAIWNTVAFYLLVLEPYPWIGALAIAGLAALTFLPVRFIHPVRVARWRALHILLLFLWGALAILTVFRNLDPGLWVEVALGAIGIYLFAAGFVHARLDATQK